MLARYRVVQAEALVVSERARKLLTATPLVRSVEDVIALFARPDDRR